MPPIENLKIEQPEDSYGSQVTGYKAQKAENLHKLQNSCVLPTIYPRKDVLT